MIEVPGENGRYMFADLTPEQFAAGIEWLSEQPVSYESAAESDKEQQTWIAVINASSDEIDALRSAMEPAG